MYEIRVYDPITTASRRYRVKDEKLQEGILWDRLQRSALITLSLHGDDDVTSDRLQWESRQV